MRTDVWYDYVSQSQHLPYRLHRIFRVHAHTIRMDGIHFLPQTVPYVRDPIVLGHADPVERLQHVLEPAQYLYVHMQVVRVSYRGFADVDNGLLPTDVPELGLELGRVVSGKHDHVRFLERCQGRIEVAHADSVEGQWILERNDPGTHPGVRHRYVPGTGERLQRGFDAGPESPGRQIRHRDQQCRSMTGQHQRIFRLAEHLGDPGQGGRFMPGSDDGAHRDRCLLAILFHDVLGKLQHHRSGPFPAGGIKSFPDQHRDG